MTDFDRNINIAVQLYLGICFGPKIILISNKNLKYSFDNVYCIPIIIDLGGGVY